MLPGDYTGTWNSPFKAPKPRALLRVVRRANDKKRWIQWIQWKRPPLPHRHHDPPYRIQVSNALGAIYASAVEWPGAALSPECALGYLLRRPAQKRDLGALETVEQNHAESLWRGALRKLQSRRPSSSSRSRLTPSSQRLNIGRQLRRPLFRGLLDASTAKPFSVC